MARNWLVTKFLGPIPKHAWCSLFDRRCQYLPYFILLPPYFYNSPTHILQHLIMLLCWFLNHQKLNMRYNSEGKWLPHRTLLHYERIAYTFIWSWLCSYSGITRRLSFKHIKCMFLYNVLLSCLFCKHLEIPCVCRVFLSFSIVFCSPQTITGRGYL